MLQSASVILLKDCSQLIKKLMVNREMHGELFFSVDEVLLTSCIWPKYALNGSTAA